MKRFAITGNPVGHSKSPVLFNAAYADTQQMTYELLPATNAQEAIMLFKQGNFAGMNITVPFKTNILPYIDEITNKVTIIGAANTIVCQPNGHTKAYNTDYEGVIGALSEFGISLVGKRCMVLGVGGAGKAAIYALTRSGASVTIANRTLSHAQDFASKLNAAAIDLAEANSVFNQFDIIINTLYPTIDCIDTGNLHNRQVIMDASYSSSPLLEKSARQGCVGIDGRYWLLHQAIPAFVLFTGITPDIKAMRNILGI